MVDVSRTYWIFIILKTWLHTRVTKSMETLIDLILTNNKRRALQTGVVDTQMSDHSLVYTIIRVTVRD